MTRDIALAGALLALDSPLRDRLAASVTGRDDLRVRPGLFNDEAAVRALPAGTTVVALVADQLSLLNAAYCREVLALRVSAPFPVWVRAHREDARFVPKQMLDPVLARPDLELVAVPWTGDETASLDHLLERVPVTDPEAGDPLAATLPGPTLVAAARLFHKRLEASGSLERRGSEQLTAAVARLRATAEEQDWDHTTFWGWNRALQQETRDHVGGGDQAFAEQVWGTAWPLPTVQQPIATTTLGESRPEVTYGVLDTVQVLVQEAGSERPHVEPCPSVPEYAKRVRRPLRR